MRSPVLFLILCFGLVFSSIANAGLLFGNSDCGKSCTARVVVQEIPVSDVPTAVNPAPVDQTRFCRPPQEPEVPKADGNVPKFDMPDVNIDLGDSAAAVDPDVSLLSILAGVGGLISGYFVTRQNDDTDEKDPAVPDVVV